MQQTKKSYLLPIYFLLFIIILLCGIYAQFSIISSAFKSEFLVTNVGELKPEKNNNIIYIKGQVINIVTLLDQRVYQVQDSTGKIWVLSNQTSLKLKDQILVKGNVRFESIPIAGRELGEMYIQEQELLERTPGQ